jgi:hypothetical protein
LWWTHLKDSCNGSEDPELLEHAQAAADKHFAAEAKKKSSARPMKQTSVVKLNAAQLHAQADEAVARWAFAQASLCEQMMTISFATLCRRWLQLVQIASTLGTRGGMSR